MEDKFVRAYSSNLPRIDIMMEDSLEKTLILSLRNSEM